MSESQKSVRQSVDERIAARLLSRPSGDAAPTEHLGDEMLAMFCAGTLPASDRESSITHLADCRRCRAAAALILRDQELESPVLPKTITAGPLAWAGVLFALAASMLIAFGLWRQLAPVGPDDEPGIYLAAKEKLFEGDFDGATQLAEEADRRGLTSPRIRNLRAEAARRFPTELALAYAGRISDFGYDLGGVVARGPAQVEGLAAAEAALGASDDPESLLNRGHLELSRNRIEVARALFQQAVDRSPSDPTAWLGLGLACFFGEDHPSAERAFSQSLTLKPTDRAAGWNLAMTLEELGRFPAAIATWQRLLPSLSDADRRRVERHLADLDSEK